ncbi:hypothetical protein [Flavobacterium sp.]
MIEDILNGWKNYFVGQDKASEEVAKHRAKICSECPAATKGLHTAVLPDFQIKEIQGMYCSKEKGGCGCPLSPAVRSKNYKCPMSKW